MKRWNEIDTTTGKPLPNALQKQPGLLNSCMEIPHPLTGEIMHVRVSGVDPILPSTHVMACTIEGKCWSIRAETAAAALAEVTP